MIFVALPYSDTNRIMERARYQYMNEYLAKLFHNRQHAVAPVAIGHPLLQWDLPGDYKFWQDYAKDLISRCDEVHVLMLDGWDKSVGVADEIKTALELNKPVKYITKEEAAWDITQK